MDKYKVMAIALGGFAAGMACAVTGSGGKAHGGIDSASAAESDCTRWSYFLDTTYDSGKCASADDACNAPAGWEPVGGFRGMNAEGMGADLVLMRKCAE